jgi:hypothetical protein
MAQEVFVGDVYHTAIRDGKDLYAAASEDIKPGLLCLVTSGSSASKSGASDTPVGVAYGARQQVYRPTSKTFADGEELVLLKGYFHCYYSSDFFDTVPTPGATIYVYTGGLMDTAGSVAVGRCERVLSRMEEVGGIGASQTLYEIAFDLIP